MGKAQKANTQLFAAEVVKKCENATAGTTLDNQWNQVKNKLNGNYVSGKLNKHEFTDAIPPPSIN